MNKILPFIIFTSLILSCQTSKETITKSIQQQNCPHDGTCYFEVIKNKGILILKDEFKKSYHKINDKKGSVLLKYGYNRNQNSDVADDHYSEIIYIEIDENVTSLELKNESLSKANVSFGRICYCRGATGYYKVKKGDLVITREGKRFDVSLYFTIDEVPQIITSFTEVFEF